MNTVDHRGPFEPARKSPFVGLAAYTQNDAPIFFGRDDERRVLISNLRASRLTLLYARSGTGKSSLLRAGVASRLRELAQRSREERGSARNVPVVFSSWHDEPTDDLIDAIEEAIAPLVTGDSAVRLPRTGLDHALEAASRAADATLLVILDQFEEYLLARSRETREGRFADEVATSLKRPDLPANFLIAIREDAYSGLGDLFKHRIDNVYGNYLHLENLSRECAREAITKPLDRMNELHRDLAAVEIEPALVEAVLDQLSRPEEIALDETGTEPIHHSNGHGTNGEIAAPYLQLVMQRLWDTELDRSAVGPQPPKLHLETLAALGGASTIVRTHVDRALGDLPEEDRNAAVDIFQHLVTRSGTKIALAASDLVDYTSHSKPELQNLLERLTQGDVRILHDVPPPPGKTETRFEISHDLLAPAILDWRIRQERAKTAQRLEREAEDARDEARRQRRRARTFRAAALALVILLVGTVIATLVALDQRSVAERARRAAQRAVVQAQRQSQAQRADALRAQAALEIPIDPPAGVVIAVEAAMIDPTRNATFLLEKELSRIGTALPGGEESIPQAVFSPDASRVVSVDAAGSASIWDARSGRIIKSLKTRGRVSAAAFSPNGDLLATVGLGGDANIWNASTGRLVHHLKTRGSLLTVSFSPDGRKLVTAGVSDPGTIWNVRTGKTTPNETDLGFGGGPVYRASFGATDKRILFLSSHQDATSFTLLRSNGSSGAGIFHGSLSSPFGASVSSNGKLVVTIHAHNRAAVWRLGVQSFRQITPSGKSRPDIEANVSWIATLSGHTAPLTTAVFNTDASKVVTASIDGTARVWDRSGKGVRVLRGHRGPVLDASFDPSGRIVVTAGSDGTVRVWRTASGKELRVIHVTSTGLVLSARPSANGKVILTVTSNGIAQLWNTQTGRLMFTLGSPRGSDARPSS